MLLRSSSTPVLGSLLQSFSETPNNHHHQSELHHTPNSINLHAKLSCTATNNGGSSHQDFRKSLFHSPSVAEIKSTSTTTTPVNGFRRVQSEGNLESLADNSHNVDDFKKSARKTISSFSFHHLETSFEDDYSDEETETESQDEDDEDLELEDTHNQLRVRSNLNGYGRLQGFASEGKMYLATGLGFSGIDCVDNTSSVSSMEEHYKKMLEGNPGNPLFMRNYAQFLYQIKGDLRGGEEYYSRAILADPEDGEILSQYAKLIWELHRDTHRAAYYFERAVRASSSQDSHIHAAYASFLWDTENDEDEEYAVDSPVVVRPHGFMASAASA